MCHPSFSYCSASHCLRCLCGKWAVPLVKVDLLRIQWDSLKIFGSITGYLYPAATYACLYESGRIRIDTACKAIGYTLSPYHSTHSPHHWALDRSINLQHSFSSLFFLPVHCVHPNQVQRSTRCCLHAGCNTTRWPSGWHQTWRCGMSPLGAVVWLEQ